MAQAPQGMGPVIPDGIGAPILIFSGAFHRPSAHIEPVIGPSEDQQHPIPTCGSASLDSVELKPLVHIIFLIAEASFGGKPLAVGCGNETSWPGRFPQSRRYH